MFIGFNVGFFPMHVSGLLGMPRRIYTYSASSGLGTLNLVTTIGAYVFSLGVFVATWNIYRSRTKGAIAGQNPWGAGTLEWWTTSPPEHFNFARIPVVSGRMPLWEDTFVSGPSLDAARLTPVTSAIDATPEEPAELPNVNLWAVIVAVGILVTVVALLSLSYWIAAAGGVLTLFSLARWLWPPAVPAVGGRA
jgi:hypothetical protein